MSEKHDELNVEFLHDLFERLKVQEKRARIRTVFLLAAVLMSAIVALSSLLKQRGNIPDEFLLMKVQQNVERHNKPIRDSIELYLSRMPESNETRKLRSLVNQLDTNTVISIDKFSGKRPFEPGD